MQLKFRVCYSYSETCTKGCRVLEGNSQTSYDDFIQMVYEDYNVEKSVFEVILSYKISKSKQLPADTPPVLIGNNRQFQSYLGQTKNATVRLCVELKEKVLYESEEEIIDDLGSSDLPKTKTVDVYGIVEENIENVDVYTPTDNVVEGQKSEAVEDGEDDESRFDYCDDSDGTDSDDENFSLYGIPPEEEDKTKVPSKKRSLSVYVEEDKGDATYETLELSSLGLAIGQCFETKGGSRNLRRLKKLVPKKSEKKQRPPEKRYLLVEQRPPEKGATTGEEKSALRLATTVDLLGFRFEI
ncbi:hypothetical protein ISN45_At05g029440 [Arabidopsis thaliana x Arabidopsis arenosa]|uniref:Uncharacterized protein n=1 Tax=Arabidopsis thaliana x Arabidopsis arenosa TaxID=1240361 RepID=A0A8T2D0G9_9BRAS|nr:hypothetical protein ISN45_At05g029440 [Arabidopsis thaliana x Arabidopsis arenosa]